MTRPGLLVQSHSGLEPQVFSTGTAEMHSVTLDDGTLAYLNSKTKLEWFGHSGERRAVLHEGEAFFEVAPDTTRPFRVAAAGGEIRVLGTRFNVYRRKGGQVSVSVLDGAAQVEGHVGGTNGTVWHRDLQASQCMRYGPEGLIREVRTTPAASNAGRWREGMLMFSDKPLPQVIEDLGRYTDRKILIRDPRLNRLHIVGTMRTHDIRAALARLEKVAPVTLTESSDAFMLDYRD